MVRHPGLVRSPGLPRIPLASPLLDDPVHKLGEGGLLPQFTEGDYLHQYNDKWMLLKERTFKNLSSKHLLVFLTIEKVLWKVDCFLFVSPSLFYGLLYLVMVVIRKRMRIQHFIFISRNQTHKRMPHNHEGRHPLHHGVHRGEVVTGRGVVNVSSDKIISSNP